MRKNNLSINRPYAILDSYDGSTFNYLDEGNDSRPYNFAVNPDYKIQKGEIIYPFPEKHLASLLIVWLIMR